MSGTRSPKRILCVEDDLDTCKLIKTVLSGFELICAETAESAWNLFNGQIFSLVILDYHLPQGVSGLELCERIRSHDYSTPVVVVSGDPELSESRVRIAGGQQLITKGSPTFIDDLYKAAKNLAINVN